MQSSTGMGILLSAAMAACAAPSDDPAATADGGVPGDPTGGTIDGAVAMTDGAATTSSTGPYFTTAMFFNRDVSALPKASNSDSIIAALSAAGGWGNSNKMQIDFDLDVLTANASTPKQSFTPTGDFFSPDCDLTSVPVPLGGNLEGETGYACL